MNEFFIKKKSNGNGCLMYSIYLKESLGDQELLEKRLKATNKIRKKRKNESNREKEKFNLRNVAKISGWRLKIMEPYIKEKIKKTKKNALNYDPNQSSKEKDEKNGKKHTLLSEEDGIRLALLFKTASQVQKMPKIDNILRNISSMGREETYYWYSKIFSNDVSNYGVKAFRILVNK